MENSNPMPKKKLFICKFCNKKYPCGKSLGGHIRIHLNGNGNGNSTDLDEDTDMKLNTIKTSSGSAGKKDSDPEAAAQSGGYVLRENPKKTKRFMVDSNNTNLLREKICKECGKGFQSLKALCGHMASHSKNGFEDHSETTDQKLKAQVFDSQSDNETSSALSKRRRSTRTMRYKTIGVYSGSLSSGSDDIEQEQEEVAMCLMMLSKDSGFKGCFSSNAEFSDNNSVVAETKSSPKLRINVRNGINCVYNANGILEMKKPKQQQVMPIGNDDSENSDSGYFRNGPKKAESEISVHGFAGNDDSKKQKLEFGCRFDGFNPELGKRLSRFRRVKTGFAKDLIEENGECEESDRVFRKRGKSHDSYNPEFHSNKASKTAECRSVVANRTSHKGTNGCSESIHESGENSLDTDSVPNRKGIQSGHGKAPIENNVTSNSHKKLGTKKGRVHECPFCFKVFKSGQALGGHKRSHFVGGAEDRTVVINQEVPEGSMSALIDLNLPAPMEEDTNGYYLSSW